MMSGNEGQPVFEAPAAIPDSSSAEPETPGVVEVRSPNAIRKEIDEAEERLLDLFGDDPDKVAAANDLLDALTELRRERERIVLKRAETRVEEKAADKAMGRVLQRFVGGRPNSRILKAEANLIKVGLVENASSARKKAFDDALFELHVAHGYAMSRALHLDGAVEAFRARVVEVLDEMRVQAVNAEQEQHAGAFRRTAKVVGQLRVTPGDFDLLAEVGSAPAHGSDAPNEPAAGEATGVSEVGLS